MVVFYGLSGIQDQKGSVFPGLDWFIGLSVFGLFSDSWMGFSGFLGSGLSSYRI